jgi:hypothetical protein
VGFLITLAFLGLLDLAKRTTAIGTQPAVEATAFGHEPSIQSESSVLTASKASEPMQGLVSETGSIPRAPIAPVPLPMRKPELVYKVPNGKGANAVTQTRIAQQKNAPPKPMR